MTIRRKKLFHVKECDFQLFTTSACTKQLIRPNEGKNVTNTEVLLIGDNFSNFFFTAGND